MQNTNLHNIFCIEGNMQNKQTSSFFQAGKDEQFT